MRLRATLIIPMGDGRLPLRVSRCLGDFGVDFVLFSKDRRNVARKSKFCREFVYSDPQNDAALIDQLLALEESKLPEILFPITTLGFQFVARNRTQLSLRFRIPPVAPIESLEIASNKRRLHEFSLNHELPVLPSIPLEEISKSEKKPLSFPALAKTTNREFGSGFERINSLEELDSFRDSIDRKHQTDYIIQPFIKGKDVSFSAYCVKGEIRSYTVWRALFYGSKKYQIPHCIEFLENPRALALASRLLHKLRWEGVCDIDFFEEEETGDLWLLEVNARLWGNVVGCAQQGVNFPQLLCEAALDEIVLPFSSQSDGIYCYPKGIPAALSRKRIRRALLRHPLATTGLGPVLSDIGPEFYKFYLKVRSPLSELFKKLFSTQSEG